MEAPFSNSSSCVEVLGCSLSSEEAIYIEFFRNHSVSNDTALCLNVPLFPPLENLLLGYSEFFILLYRRYWWISLIIITAYAFLIRVGQWYMLKRPKAFGLRKWLIAWNLFLAFLSLIFAIKGIPFFIHALWNRTWTYGTCFPPLNTRECALANIHSLAFGASKVAELGDTAFLVLRKRRVIFLHWYHHSTVLFCAWYFGGHVLALGMLFGAVNSFVHVLMYSYFGLRAMKCRLPLWVAILLTSTQIFQMIIGILATSVILHAKLNVYPNCMMSTQDAAIIFIMFGTYFLLFLKFFYENYLNEEKRNLRRVRRESRRTEAAVPLTDLNCREDPN